MRVLTLALVAAACTGGDTPPLRTDLIDLTDTNPTTDVDPSGDTGKSVLGENLLVNGDAEKCSMKGWTSTSAGAVQAVVQQTQGKAGVVLSHEGRCFFSFALVQVDQVTIVQSGAAVPGDLLRLSGMAGRTDEDVGTATLTAQDANGTALAAVTTGPLEFEAWEAFSATLAVPDNAVTWNLALHGELNTGGLINVYFDGMSLRAE